MTADPDKSTAITNRKVIDNKSMDSDLFQLPYSIRRIKNPGGKKTDDTNSGISSRINQYKEKVESRKMLERAKFIH